MAAFRGMDRRSSRGGGLDMLKGEQRRMLYFVVWMRILSGRLGAPDIGLIGQTQAGSSAKQSTFAPLGCSSDRRLFATVTRVLMVTSNDHLLDGLTSQLLDCRQFRFHRQ